MSDITVAIPTIPIRTTMLGRAINSVARQSTAAAGIAIAVDNDHLGAARTRDRATDMVQTEFVAYLDDDDEFRPFHLRDLRKEIERTEADLVFPWFDVVGGVDPFPDFEGMEWDNDKPRQVPITFLARVEAIRNVGGFSEGWVDDLSEDEHGNRAGEDFFLITKLVEAGAKIVHLNKRTWKWYHHAHNTSGMGARW